MSQKRKQLLTTAEHLFYENGFHHVGLKRIVSDSGVALMTLYNHFPSKEDLILEVLKSRETRYLSLLENHSEKSKHEKAKKIVAAHVKWLSKHGNGCMFLRAKEEFAHVNEAIIRQVEAHKNQMIESFQLSGFTRGEALQLALLLEGATALAEVKKLSEVECELKKLIEQLYHE
ncbi:transcriptional regulator, TetR family [Bacillus sp. JCM 19046]|nr:transcriptional regulator, TetR family [Bacillus sp. JCM 19045]GAF19783.1 transcriptional regulator, TetR family [Bacillus sp. JCM 19046]